MYICMCLTVNTRIVIVIGAVMTICQLYFGATVLVNHGWMPVCIFKLTWSYIDILREVILNLIVHDPSRARIVWWGIFICEHTFLTRYAVNTGRRAIDIYGCKLIFRQFAHARRIDENDVNIRVTHFRVTSRVTCNDVTYGWHTHTDF